MGKILNYGPKITIILGNLVSCRSTDTYARDKKCLLGAEWKDRIWENLKFTGFAGKKQGTRGQCPDYKCQVFNVLWPELPPARDTDVLAAALGAVDDQAGRGEAPNNQGIALNDFFAARISPGIVIETPFS